LSQTLKNTIVFFSQKEPFYLTNNDNFKNKQNKIKKPNAPISTVEGVLVVALVGT
jgi:hypothetical protein